MKTGKTPCVGAAALLACFLVLGAVVVAGTPQTRGRIPRFIDNQGSLGDSGIQANDDGNIGIGARPEPDLRLVVNGGPLGVRARTDGDLGVLAVSQRGSGAIATFRNGDNVVRLTVDEGGLDVKGAIAIGGQKVIDAAGLYVGDVEGVQKFNPLRIAQLRWYGASETGATFASGGLPFAAASDGACIWVAHSFDDSVSKLRASDGAILGTFPVGRIPRAVAFDGSSIWVANGLGDSVTKLRASDGATLGTFAVGAAPFALAFDGSAIWVANAGDGTVTRLRSRDGATLGTFAVGSGPSGVVFDGASIWVTNTGDDFSKL
jgi:DNA-binding beta-propeller fold protein YncE